MTWDDRRADTCDWVAPRMPPPPGVSHGYTSQVLVTWRIVGEALVLGILSTALGSIYPAWKASRKNVVDALRHNS